MRRESRLVDVVFRPCSTNPTDSAGDRPIWVAGQGWVKPPPSWPAQPPPQAAEPRPRRFWLWVIIAAIGLLIVLCCISSVYLQTSSGQRFYHNIQTRAAKEELAPLTMNLAGCDDLVVTSSRNGRGDQPAEAGLWM